MKWNKYPGEQTHKKSKPDSFTLNRISYSHEKFIYKKTDHQGRQHGGQKQEGHARDSKPPIHFDNKIEGSPAWLQK
jgi:hypothetical protein